MNIAYQIKKWDVTYPVIFTVLRSILGLFLTFRGIYFLNNTAPLYDLIKNSSLNSLHMDTQLGMFITWAHILGGTFITLGLFTRIFVWIQMPIVLGAIIFINIPNIGATFTDLLFSIAILILLVIFAFEGGGVISMDNYVKKHAL